MADGQASGPTEWSGPAEWSDPGEWASEPADGDCSPSDLGPDAGPAPILFASPDHPELAFIQAEAYARGRPDGPPIWIVVHDMEASETSTRAENTAQYFATLPDGRSVSSHYTCDSDSVVQCVRLADTAYTVGNRPGNYRGINWEFAGFASQTRQQWLDAYGVAMFDQAAPIIRSDAQRYAIPLVRRTVAELRAYTPGVASHHDLGLAFGGTTHTDPGPNFPWDYFMAVLQEDTVASDLDQFVPPDGGVRQNTFMAYHLLRAIMGGAEPIHGKWGASDVPEPNKLWEILREIRDKPPVAPAPVDVDALAAALAKNEAFLNAIAQRAVTLHAQRLSS